MSSAIRQWLEELGLARYGDRFEADDIDLDVVPSLSEQDLEKLGVSMGHRKKLLKAIAALGGDGARRSDPTSANPTTSSVGLTRPADGAEARKIVTILFADLAGSTALHERLDPESVRSFMEGYYLDPSERAAADAELFKRYVAGGDHGMPRGFVEFLTGLNKSDHARVRAGLCDDFVLKDHRRTGLGHLDADAYIASLDAINELMRSRTIYALYVAASAPHGRVLMLRAAGVNREGGEYESFLAALILYRDDRVASFEFFEPEQLAAALGRLEQCAPKGA
jgi:hypothetical protein